MTENMKTYNAARSVPKEAKSEIKGGRLKGYTNINAQWRIEKMTELFGCCGVGWYYTIDKQWTEIGAENEVKAFCNISLYIKCGDGWSAPIAGTGGSAFVTMERGGAYVNDECYKMALTDALSVACKNLGIGADVYFAESRTKYDSTASPASAGQIKAIKELCQKTGTDIAKLAEYYKSDKIESISADAAAAAIEILKARKAV